MDDQEITETNDGNRIQPVINGRGRARGRRKRIIRKPPKGNERARRVVNGVVRNQQAHLQKRRVVNKPRKNKEVTGFGELNKEGEKRLQQFEEDQSFQRILAFRKQNPQARVLVLLGEIHKERETIAAHATLLKAAQDKKIGLFLENISLKSDERLHEYATEEYQLHDVNNVIYDYYCESIETNLRKDEEYYAANAFKNDNIFSKLAIALKKDFPSYKKDKEAYFESLEILKKHMKQAKSFHELHMNVSLRERNLQMAGVITDKLKSQRENAPVVNFAIFGGAHIQEYGDEGKINLQWAFEQKAEKTGSNSKDFKQHEDKSFDIAGGVRVFKLDLELGTEGTDVDYESSQKAAYLGAIYHVLHQIIDPK